jgi:hypothetical protein
LLRQPAPVAIHALPLARRSRVARNQLGGSWLGNGDSPGLLSRVLFFRLGDHGVEGWLGLVVNVE